MSRKHKFLRKCIACNEFKNKDLLIKVTKNFFDEKIIVEPKIGIFGRSVYICRNNNCINAALKNKKIDKNLKKHVNTDVNELLKAVLEK